MPRAIPDGMVFFDKRRGDQPCSLSIPVTFQLAGRLVIHGRRRSFAESVSVIR